MISHHSARIRAQDCCAGYGSGFGLNVVLTMVIDYKHQIGLWDMFISSFFWAKEELIYEDVLRLQPGKR